MKTKVLKNISFVLILFFVKAVTKIIVYILRCLDIKWTRFDCKNLFEKCRYQKDRLMNLGDNYAAKVINVIIQHRNPCPSIFFKIQRRSLSGFHVVVDITNESFCKQCPRSS